MSERVLSVVLVPANVGVRLCAPVCVTASQAYGAMSFGAVARTTVSKTPICTRLISDGSARVVVANGALPTKRLWAISSSHDIGQVGKTVREKSKPGLTHNIASAE